MYYFWDIFAILILISAFGWICNLLDNNYDNNDHNYENNDDDDDDFLDFYDQNDCDPSSDHSDM
jgi:hypothetical protein